MKHLATILHTALILLTSSAAVPLRWTVETSRATPAAFEAYQGETLGFEAALMSHGKPLQAPLNYALYWQTNGMGAVYWSTNCAPGAGATNVMRATWRPEYDVGSRAYNCFIGAPGSIYHAAFQLRLRPSPGAVPNALPLPTPTIDFARVTVLNPPWPTNDLTSAVLSNAAAIASHSSQLSQLGHAVNDHIGDTTNNPHRVTSAQVGALPVGGGKLTGDLLFALKDAEGVDFYGIKYVADREFGSFTNDLIDLTRAAGNQRPLFCGQSEHATRLSANRSMGGRFEDGIFHDDIIGSWKVSTHVNVGAQPGWWDSDLIPDGSPFATSNSVSAAVDVAMTAAIRSAENYTDGVLDSAAYLPRFYFKGGRWYRQDLVDNGPDDIEMTLERYGDDVFVWFEAVGGPATVTLTNVKASATAPKLERLKDGAWSPFAFPVLLAEGERVIFRTQYGVTNSAYWKSDTECWRFGGTGRYAVGGDATALFVYEGSIPCPAEAFHGLFENNECLVDASRLVLPFAELAYDCYAMMFAGCANLVKGPHALPAKDVSERGYLSMFNGCESLDLAPRILAEDAAATYAMANMFVNCKALDHVYLPYLTNATAYAMFGFANNAHNVSRIATLANTFGGSFASGTTDRGVLICKTLLGTQETIARGPNACPTNWLVENIDAPFVQFTNAYGVPSEVTVLWSSGTVPKLEYSADGETWTAITLVKGTAFTLATLDSYGDRVMVRAETGKTNVAMKGTQFLATGKVDVSGNIMSLVSQSCPAAIPANNMFMGLFGLTSTPSDAESVWDSDGIAASDGLMLPSVSLKQYCYDEMFAHCRRMRYSPLTLPAANLQQRNYCLMFWRCIDMIETPDVLAPSASSTLSIRSIFMNCISARRARFPYFANVTQNATFDWALRCDEWFSHQDVKWEYIETVMSPFAKNNEWVQGLEYTRGLFVCPVSLGNRETIRRGDSACPVGWDVINY